MNKGECDVGIITAGEIESAFAGEYNKEDCAREDQGSFSLPFFAAVFVLAVVSSSSSYCKCACMLHVQSTFLLEEIRDDCLQA